MEGLKGSDGLLSETLCATRIVSHYTILSEIFAASAEIFESTDVAPCGRYRPLGGKLLTPIRLYFGVLVVLSHGTSVESLNGMSFSPRAMRTLPA
jgi:hypothetical protein